MLVAPVMVAVYTVVDPSVGPALNAKVAIAPLASRVTVPVGLVQGDAQVTVKLAAPLSGAMASLNVAVMTGLATTTPVARLTGVTAVTVGASCALPLVPRIGPRLPLQPAANTHNATAAG